MNRLTTRADSDASFDPDRIVLLGGPAGTVTLSHARALERPRDGASMPLS